MTARCAPRYPRASRHTRPWRVRRCEGTAGAEGKDLAAQVGRFEQPGCAQAGKHGSTVALRLLKIGDLHPGSLGQLGRDAPPEVVEAVPPLVPRGEQRWRP